RRGSWTCADGGGKRRARPRQWTSGLTLIPMPSMVAMAGSDDKFNYPNLTLPSEFLRQLNLPPDFAQRLKAWVSPEVVRKLHQFAQCSPYRTLTPQVREMIASVLKKRRDKAAIEEELRRLELWLDSEIDRKLWDPTAATSAAPREAPPA